MHYIKVAYFGQPGSFTQIAAQEYVKQKQITDCLFIPCQNIQEVIDYVLAGNSYGVIPYKNSIAGNIPEYNEIIQKYPELEIGDIKIPVHHCLLGKTKSTRGITTVVSHPHALAQCKKSLSARFPGVKLLNYASTSTAARDLASGKLPDNCAVIASSTAAKNYGLQIISKNIEDLKSNHTSFKVFYLNNK